MALYSPPHQVLSLGLQDLDLSKVDRMGLIVDSAVRQRVIRPNQQLPEQITQS